MSSGSGCSGNSGSARGCRSTHGSRFSAAWSAELVDASDGIVDPAPLDKLAAFYDHLGDLALGYVKDLAWREEELRLVHGWAADLRRLADALEPVAAVPARQV